jgi:hypothetical protein
VHVLAAAGKNKEDKHACAYCRRPAKTA